MEILLHGQVTVKTETLRHISDPAADFRGLLLYVVAEDEGPARRGPQQSQEHADGRGLPRAVRPQKPEYLPTMDAEADLVHRGEVAKTLGQSLHNDRIVVRSCKPLISF